MSNDGIPCGVLQISCEWFHLFFPVEGVAMPDFRFKIMRPVLLALVLTTFALPACQRPGAREVKALNDELERARRHRDFGNVESVARQILKRAPQHEGAWAALVEARFQMK